MTKIKNIFSILLILLIFSSIGSAATLISTEIKETQYGTFLASKGYGGILYQYTYSDGSVSLKYVEGKSLPFMAVTANVARTIAVTTHYDGRISWCDSMVATGSDGSSGYSYSCGNTMSTESAYISTWQPYFVEQAKSRFGYVSIRDTVTLNGKVVASPAVMTPIPTSIPTPIITPPLIPIVTPTETQEPSTVYKIGDTKFTPGFEIVYPITGIFATYLMMRRRV